MGLNFYNPGHKNFESSTYLFTLNTCFKLGGWGKNLTSRSHKILRIHSAMSWQAGSWHIKLALLSAKIIWIEALLCRLALIRDKPYNYIENLISLKDLVLGFGLRFVIIKGQCSVQITLTWSVVFMECVCLVSTCKSPCLRMSSAVSVAMIIRSDSYLR